MPSVLRSLVGWLCLLAGTLVLAALAIAPDWIEAATALRQAEQLTAEADAAEAEAARWSAIADALASDPDFREEWARRELPGLMPSPAGLVVPGHLSVDLRRPSPVRVREIPEAAGMPLEGTCEGQMACSTCHVIVDPEWFDRLPETSEEEEDMLDLAYAVERTSRLSCQIELTEELNGLSIKVPSEAKDMSRM